MISDNQGTEHKTCCLSIYQQPASSSVSQNAPVWTLAVGWRLAWLRLAAKGGAAGDGGGRLAQAHRNGLW